MHSYPRNLMIIGRAVMYYARSAHAFSAGIKCQHCTYPFVSSSRIRCRENYRAAASYVSMVSTRVGAVVRDANAEKQSTLTQIQYSQLHARINFRWPNQVRAESVRNLTPDFRYVPNANAQKRRPNSLTCCAAIV